MLKDLLIKKIVKVIMKQFKLDEILKYVQEPNELDKKVKSMSKTLNKYGKYIEEIEKDIAEIKAIKKKLKLFK